jgi:hypothetical protein
MSAPCTGRYGRNPRTQERVVMGLMGVVDDLHGGDVTQRVDGLIWGESETGALAARGRYRTGSGLSER